MTRLAYRLVRWFDNRLLDLETEVSIWRDSLRRKLQEPQTNEDAADYAALS